MKEATKERLAKLACQHDRKDHSRIELAMLEVQTAMPKIQRDTDAYNYKYAPLEQILGHLRPLLNAAQLVLSYGHQAEDGLFWTYANVTHVPSGDTWKAAFPIPLPAGGGNAAQDMGKIATYGRRYATLSLFGLAPEDEDDDGAGLSQQPQRPQGGQDPRRTPPKPQAPQQAPPDGVIEGAIMEVKRGLWKGLGRNGMPTELCKVVVEDMQGEVHELTNFTPQWEATIAEAESYVGSPDRVLVKTELNTKGKLSIIGIKPMKDMDQRQQVQPPGEPPAKTRHFDEEDIPF